jgi:thimet oligopeptidase
LASQFDANCTKNYTKGIWFKREDLLGVPEEVVSNYKFDTKKQKYFVSLVPSVMLPVMKFCENTKTRKAIAELSQAGVGEANNFLFRKILKLRSEITKILNFKTFSHLAMDTQLVHEPQEAIKFCKDLIKNMKTQFSKDKKRFSAYLRKGEKLSYYNTAFVENLAIKKELGVDQNEFKKYFEFESTMQAMFNIWSKYFDVSVKFERNLKEVHSDILYYSVFHRETGAKIGTAIFDLFPRDGKYGHACVEQMQPRVKKRRRRSLSSIGYDAVQLPEK